MQKILFVGAWTALLLASCGRSNLSPGDLEALAVAGASGGGAAAGKPNGGSSAAGRAGSSSSGGDQGGTASSAGAPSTVGGMAPAGETGEAGAGGAPMVCDGEGLVVQRVVPPNATASFDSSGHVDAVFDCPFDPALPSKENARLYGQRRGYPSTDYPVATKDNVLWIAPEPSPFFPGERVTAWLGADLGGPYLWQYTERVSANSPGRFTAGSQDLSALTSARDIVLADLDGDHDLDLVVGAYQAPMQLWLNDGTGTLEDRGTLATQGAPAVGDVDHDGDLDIFGQGPLLLNQGDATFEVGPAYDLGCGALGDFDGDGDVDCIQYGGSRPDQTIYGYVLFNQGGGKLEPGPETEVGYSCEAADLDGDADLDLVCVGQGTRAFFNDGHGVFTRSQQKLGAVGTRQVAVGDVDGDHDVDLAVAVWFGGGKYRPNELWLNDGTGHFSEGGAIGAEGAEIALGDLDGDGDLDLIVSECTPYGPNSGPFHPVHVHENDGKGVFHDTGRTLGDPAYHWFELGDLDGDGDLDAFLFHQMGRADNYSSVWFNQK